MTSHRIHLRGPWEYEWLTDWNNECQPVPLHGTVAMPREWKAIFGPASGTVRFRRKFHRPTNLEADEKVFIVLTEIRGQGSCWLNDDPAASFVADGGTVELEVTSQLRPFNELFVEISCDISATEQIDAGLFGAVAIEIRSS